VDDTRVSARKTRTEQQQNERTSRTPAESSSDPSSAAPPLDIDEEPLLSDEAILSALGYPEGSAFEVEMGDQTEEKDC
jgi:hypothetical protein